MSRPRALDLFCGAGGSGMGLHGAGFDVTGVDITMQKNYPFRFVQADALAFPFAGYDLVWASPPCQFAARLGTHHRAKHANLIPAIRERLIEAGVPYIIENVADARYHLHNPIMLCGSMFGLGVWRHRYFECSTLGHVLTPPCNHSNVPVLITGSPRRRNVVGVVDRTEPTTQERRDAMDIGWMTRKELDQAIPPAYSHFLGTHILSQLRIAA